MSINNLTKCRHLNDQLYTKISEKHVMDVDGNVYIPWHNWYVRAKSFLEYNISDSFTYWSNDVVLTKNNYTKNKITELPIELARLKCSGLIDNDQFNSIKSMIESEDLENFAVAIEVLKTYRRKRLKIGKQQKNRR